MLHINNFSAMGRIGLMWRWWRRRYAIICLVCVLMCFWLSWEIVSGYPVVGFVSLCYRRWLSTGHHLHCYRNRSLETLIAISGDDGPFYGPGREAPIFFHETSCRSFESGGKILLNARQACAIESAARYNPKHEVFILFTSPGLIRLEGTQSDAYLKALFSYNNVRFRYISFADYISDTPVEQIYSEGLLENSRYALSHASDILRYVTLWRYGGTYMDLDVIVTGPIAALGNNYAGAESEFSVAAGVLNFDATGAGHYLASRCLFDLAHNFNGDEWGDNGPGVITRVLKTDCGASSVRDMLHSKQCHVFQVFQPHTFYAIPWRKWQLFFEPDRLDEVLRATQNRSVVLHVWNKHSAQHQQLDKTNLRIPFVYLMRQHCPFVYAATERYL